MINWQISNQYYLVDNKYCTIAGPNLELIKIATLCEITCTKVSFELPNIGTVSFPTTVTTGDNNIVPEHFGVFETLLEAQNYYNELLQDMKDNLDTKILSPKNIKMTKEIKNIVPIGNRVLIESTMYKKQSSIILQDKPQESGRNSFEKVEDRILKIGVNSTLIAEVGEQIILSPYAEPTYFQTVFEDEEKIVVQALFDSEHIHGKIV